MLCREYCSVLGGYKCCYYCEIKDCNLRCSKDDPTKCGLSVEA